MLRSITKNIFTRTQVDTSVQHTASIGDRDDGWEMKQTVNCVRSGRAACGLADVYCLEQSRSSVVCTLHGIELSLFEEEAAGAIALQWRLT